MDLISACRESSSLSAPQPRSRPSSHTVQNVMSGFRKASRSRACTLSGGECSAMFRRCSRNSSWISGPDRSSTLMCMGKRQSPRLARVDILEGEELFGALSRLWSQVETDHLAILFNLTDPPGTRPLPLLDVPGPGHPADPRRGRVGAGLTRGCALTLRDGEQGKGADEGGRQEGGESCNLCSGFRVRLSFKYSRQALADDEMEIRSEDGAGLLGGFGQPMDYRRLDEVATGSNGRSLSIEPARPSPEATD